MAAEAAAAESAAAAAEAGGAASVADSGAGVDTPRSLPQSLGALDDGAAPAAVSDPLWGGMPDQWRRRPLAHRLAAVRLLRPDLLAPALRRWLASTALGPAVGTWPISAEDAQLMAGMGRPLLLLLRDGAQVSSA
ncbi:MAG: hypothetical protein ACK4L4_19845, partial [Gemmobacter sp.]